MTQRNNYIILYYIHILNINTKKPKINAISVSRVQFQELGFRISLSMGSIQYEEVGNQISNILENVVSMPRL